MSASFASKVVRLADLDPDGVSQRVEATPDQLSIISRRLGVEGVKAFSGEATIRPAPGGATVTGVVSARLVRTCVVTLDTIEEVVEDRFDLRFTRHAPEGDLELMLEDDWPDILEGDELDLADLMVEQVALAMDPYPRKPGAAFSPPSGPDAADLSPFAVLKGLKKDPGP